MQQTLLLRRDVRVKQSESAVVLDFLGDQFVFSAEAARLFIDANDDGEIAGQSDPELIVRLSEALAGHGLLQDSSPVEPLSGMAFYAMHQRYAEHWLRPVLNHPFWARMAEGKARFSEVLGFALEKYHYIEAAHEHMGFAAANARGAMMPHLARHFVEEYTHGDIYMAGLESYYSTEKILNSVPLPTTRALINFLSEAAIEDSFSYYAANEVLQMTENVPEEEGSPVSEFYDALRHHYPNVQPLIRSFAAHTELDQKLGHENVFKEICGDVALLSAHQINRAMEQSQAAAEHLLLFLDGIHRHYSRVESPLRMPSVVGSD